MGPLDEDYIETVLTCEGDFYDPEFHTQLQDFSNRLQNLITTKGKFVTLIKSWYLNRYIQLLCHDHSSFLPK